MNFGKISVLILLFGHFASISLTPKMFLVETADEKIDEAKDQEDIKTRREEEMDDPVAATNVKEKEKKKRGRLLPRKKIGKG